MFQPVWSGRQVSNAEKVEVGEGGVVALGMAPPYKPSFLLSHLKMSQKDKTNNNNEGLVREREMECEDIIRRNDEDETEGKEIQKS